MNHSCCRSARPLTLQVLVVRICMFYSSMCLAGWPLSSEAAKPRCGSELLSDLMFVCGERGIHLGRLPRSGARPRARGIVDQCCKASGCDLHQLEMYCARPRSPEPTTPTPLTVAPPTALHLFQAVYQKRLYEHIGAPDNPKREAYRSKIKPTSPRKLPSSRRRSSLQSAASKAPPPSTSPF